MGNNEINIPEDLQQVCRDLAKIAQQHGLYELSGRFQPRNGWHGEISFSWATGRHNEDDDKIKIASTFNVFTRVSTKTE